MLGGMGLGGLMKQDYESDRQYCLAKILAKNNGTRLRLGAGNTFQVSGMDARESVT